MVTPVKEIPPLILLIFILLNTSGCFDSSKPVKNNGNSTTTSQFWLKDILYNGVDENKDEHLPDQSACHYSLSTEGGEYIRTNLQFVTYYEPQDSFTQLDVNYWVLENENYCYLVDNLGNPIEKIQFDTDNNVGVNNGIIFEVRVKSGVVIPTHVKVKLENYQKNQCSRLPNAYRCHGTIDIYNKKTVDYSGYTINRKIHIIVDPNSAKTKDFNCELIASDLNSWFNIIYKQGIAEMDSAAICTTKVDFDVNQNGFLDCFIPSTDINIDEDSIFEDECYFLLDDGNIFYFRKYRFCYPLYADAIMGDTTIMLMVDTARNHFNIGDVFDICTEDDSKKETIVVMNFYDDSPNMIDIVDALKNTYKAAEGENSCVVDEPVGFSLDAYVGNIDYDYIIVNDIFHNTEVEAYKTVSHETGHNEFGLLDIAYEKDNVNLMYYMESWLDTVPVLGYYDLRAVDSTWQKQWNEIHLHLP